MKHNDLLRLELRQLKLRDWKKRNDIFTWPGLSQLFKAVLLTKSVRAGVELLFSRGFKVLSSLYQICACKLGQQRSTQ